MNQAKKALGEKLKKAIKELGLAHIPGEWSVNPFIDENTVTLLFTCSGLNDFEDSAPWLLFGGDTILANAGVKDSQIVRKASDYYFDIDEEEEIVEFFAEIKVG